MRTNQRPPRFFFALFFAGLSSLALTAMLPAAPAKSAMTKNAAPSAPPSLGITGSGFSATLPDPKRPGKLLYELQAASASGQSQADGFHGSLTTVWARLYQNGQPSAILTAPHAVGGSAQKSVVITGTGGVTMKSLVEPGTVLTADTIVWYAAQSKIVATGHVFYHSGKSGLTMRGPRAVGYTQLKSITITGGGHGTGTF